MPKRLKNIRKWKNSWQCYVEVHGRTYSKSYPLTTPVEDMRAWIETTRKKHAKPTDARGSFAADIQDYLSRIAALPSHGHRKQQLALWATALGRDRPRRTITTAEIDRLLQTWLLDGLHANTVRNRRSALLALWHKLDGKDAENPVRAAYCPPAAKPETRGRSYEELDRVIAAMKPSASQIRIRCLLWSGLPPGMLAKITKADLRLARAELRVVPRRKGAGVEARTLPLLPQAVEAFTDFDAADLYGSYNISALNQVFVGACQRVDPPVLGVSLYDLRHSFGTMLYRVTKDLATVARFLLHADIHMTQRYAQGAMADVDRAAADLAGSLFSRLSARPVPAGK